MSHLDALAPRGFPRTYQFPSLQKKRIQDFVFDAKRYSSTQTSVKMAPRQALLTSSTLSSPDSFITATASPNNADITTDISSPDDGEPDPQYRKARELPTQLGCHCQIYLEENVHSVALNIFSSVLEPTPSYSSYGNSFRCREDKGAYCPAPNQLALLNTISIHPDFTTRPREANWTDTSTELFQHLRNILHTVGPLNGEFKEAFHFGSPRRGSPDFSRDDDDSRSDNGGLSSGGTYHEKSVFRQGHEFFNVLGWAFNCSVLYPRRWAYWKVWIEFMLDVLEKDLHERYRLDCEAHSRAGGQEGDGQCKFDLLKESILAGYVTQRGGRSGGLKWVMKSIFADGSKSSNTIFQEIWYKEHKGVSRNLFNKRKREKVNIEKGQFGGYMDDESIYSSQTSEPPTPQKRRTSSGEEELQALEPAYVESIALRQRVFVLLSFLCDSLPHPPISLPDLYEDYAKTLKSLPLSIFTAFITSTTSELLVASQVSILQDLLTLFMPSGAKSPEKVDPECYNSNGTSPAILEGCFLPYAANTIAVEDNAKLSLLLEEMLQLIWVNGIENFGRGLRESVKKGVQAREAKVKKKATRGRGRNYGSGDHSDTEARAVLEESGRRLMQLVDVIQMPMPTYDGNIEDDYQMQDVEDSIEVSFISAQSY